MKKYKVLVPFYKLSDKKNYLVNDEIELNEDQALLLINENKIESLEVEQPTKKAKK